MSPREKFLRKTHDSMPQMGRKIKGKFIYILYLILAFDLNVSEVYEKTEIKFGIRNLPYGVYTCVCIPVCVCCTNSFLEARAGLLCPFPVGATGA